MILSPRWVFCSEGTKGGMYSFFCFLLRKSNCHIISQSLFSSFISILFLNYNKVCSTTATRQDFPICFVFLSIYKSNFLNFDIFLQFRCYPRIHHLLPQFIKSHACFEARSNKHYLEKYTKCTYKH